jgi:hypothetical protein
MRGGNGSEMSNVSTSNDINDQQQSPVPDSNISQLGEGEPLNTTTTPSSTPVQIQQEPVSPEISTTEIESPKEGEGETGEVNGEVEEQLESQPLQEEVSTDQSPTPEPLPTPTQITVTIYQYDGSQETEAKEITPETTYGMLLNNSSTKFIVVIPSTQEGENDTVYTDLTNESTINTNEQNINIFIYKYANNIERQDQAPDLENNLVQITLEDLAPVENNLEMLGKKALNTSYYIDTYGILRNYTEESNQIKQVVVLDIPKDDTEPTDTENAFLNEANNTLKSISNLLLQIKTMLPSYVEISLNEKNYVISKENPYIILDKSTTE